MGAEKKILAQTKHGHVEVRGCYYEIGIRYSKKEYHRPAFEGMWRKVLFRDDGKLRLKLMAKSNHGSK
jgi:hypothetical protein